MGFSTGSRKFGGRHWADTGLRAPVEACSPSTLGDRDYIRWPRKRGTHVFTHAHTRLDSWPTIVRGLVGHGLDAEW